MEKSGFSNCLVVSEESYFVGDRLKFSQAEISGAAETEHCIAEDQKVDGGDGPDSGRVRWVECLQGPDCDEAGMF